MKTILTTLLLATLCLTSLAQSTLAAEWSYTGDTGPAHWGDLSPEYTACTHGKNQSPVDIKDAYNYEHARIKFDFEHLSNNVYFGAHGLVINFESAGFTLENHKYKLDQLHFHSPSEHRIAGKSFPLEAHFVNSDKDGNLAVISVLFRKGVENKNIQKLLNKISENKGKFVLRSFNEFTAKQLLPRTKKYYHLNGSLTTPPCSEGVLWLVMQHQVTISAAQIDALQDLLKAPNNRPIQPINARIITR